MYPWQLLVVSWALWMSLAQASLVIEVADRFIDLSSQGSRVVRETLVMEVKNTGTTAQSTYYAHIPASRAGNLVWLQSEIDSVVTPIVTEQFTHDTTRYLSPRCSLSLFDLGAQILKGELTRDTYYVDLS
jgi:hypothetical protein